jgi:hypothetical protein
VNLPYEGSRSPLSTSKSFAEPILLAPLGAMFLLRLTSPPYSNCKIRNVECNLHVRVCDFHSAFSILHSHLLLSPLLAPLGSYVLIKAHVACACGPFESTFCDAGLQTLTFLFHRINSSSSSGNFIRILFQGVFHGDGGNRFRTPTIPLSRATLQHRIASIIHPALFGESSRTVSIQD